jgi:AmmeMemoRadiSam system protein B
LKVRPAYNAGSWYAGTAKSLQRQIEEECFRHELGPGEVPSLNVKGSRMILASLCPHAGYMYSGPIAAHSYNAIANDGKPQIIVIIGPNHTGIGSGVSIMLEGVWRNPLGDVPVDSDVAKAIQKASSYIDIDETAHQYEHSIELQLPFLQYILKSDFKFVPICMLMQDLEVAYDIGKAISTALQGKNSLIIASSDMTHYETQTSAQKKDDAAIEAMKKLDEKLLFETVTNLNISMCGVGPAATAMIASKAQGAKRGILLKYATSGDVTGDKSSVVGYCSMIFTK